MQGEILEEKLEQGILPEIDGSIENFAHRCFDDTHMQEGEQGLFEDRFSLLVYFDAAFRKDRLKRPATYVHHDVIYNGLFLCIAAQEIFEKSFRLIFHDQTPFPNTVSE